MVVDYTLPILLWLCSFVLPGADATWVVKGAKGPPLAISRTADGFVLQPPKGIKAPAVPVTIRGTHVEMGKGMEIDVANHLPVKAPLKLEALQKVLCHAKRKSGCFDTVSVGNGKAQLVYVNDRGKKSAFNFQRVGD
jgi:hypothetical protein